MRQQPAVIHDCSDWTLKWVKGTVHMPVARAPLAGIALQHVPIVCLSIHTSCSFILCMSFVQIHSNLLTGPLIPDLIQHFKVNVPDPAAGNHPGVQSQLP